MANHEWGPAEAQTTLAQAVAPFGRLPAGAVAFVADALLESVDRAHSNGQVGLNLSPEAIVFGFGSSLQLGAPATSPYWMLGPERVRGEGPSARGDLFSTGALLVELLTGARPFDRQSPQATAQLLGQLKAPPSVLALSPTVPGFLEQLLHALLQPDPARRPASALAARDLLTDAVQALGREHPKVIDKLGRDPRVICGELHQAQAAAEARRGQALVQAPATRKPAVVALLRSHALVGGQPEVTGLLQHAAQAGLCRAGTPASAELEQARAAVAAQEPTPSLGALRTAGERHEAEGDLLEALALYKRALDLQPQDAALRRKVDELAGPRSDEPFAAGGAWTLELPLASDGLGAAGAAFGGPADLGAPAPAGFGPGALGAAGVVDPAPSAFGTPLAAGHELGTALPPGSEGLHGDRGAFAPSSSPGRGGPLAPLLEAFGNLEPRARLFLLVLAFGGLSSALLLWGTRYGMGEGASDKVQLELLSRAAADCPPGGGVALLQIYQAAKLAEPEAANQLMSDHEDVLPGGTRCQIHAMELTAKAELKRRDAP